MSPVYRGQLDGKRPPDAIVAVLHAEGAMTARALTELLCNVRYPWPSGEGAYPYPTYERVYATLRSLQHGGEVARERRQRTIPGPVSEFLWRLA